MMTPSTRSRTWLPGLPALVLAPVVLVALVALAGPGLLIVHAQPPFSAGQDAPELGGPTETPDREAQIDYLRRAAVRLPIAATLAAVLALRPRRRGTPHRQAPVVETQIIIAIVGAIVMLVVGASLARAFGIVGAAGLVRYRAKIADPKDAGVMLSTLAVGLASGVGLWMLALFGTGFVLLVLGLIESFEPKTTRPFTLEVKTKDPQGFKPKLEELLKRVRWEHELRTSAEDQLEYDVKVPFDKKTDRLAEQILALDSDKATAVEWKEKKEKK